MQDHAHSENLSQPNVYTQCVSQHPPKAKSPENLSQHVLRDETVALCTSLWLALGVAVAYPWSLRLTLGHCALPLVRVSTDSAVSRMAKGTYGWEVSGEAWPPLRRRFR